MRCSNVVVPFGLRPERPVSAPLTRTYAAESERSPCG
jgi:hypothetical protein